MSTGISNLPAYLLGDDAYGRKVIVLSACRLPAREDIDHEKLLMLVCIGNTSSLVKICK